MDNEKTIPSILVARDYHCGPAEPLKIHPILKILVAAVAFLLLLLLYKR